MTPPPSDRGPDFTCRWGIIGAGDVCEHKGGPPLYQLDGCELVGVCRRDRAAGQDYARRHGPCRYFESVDALLDDPSINCIYVASPPALHKAHTLAAAAAGKHVLCEKPMAADSRECLDMVKACRQYGVTLAVAYYRRGYPSIQRAKALNDTGALGELRSICLNTQFPISHRLDLVQFFCGDTTSVQLQENASGDFNLLATTASGAKLRTSLGFEESASTEKVCLEGSEAEIFIDDLKGGSLILKKDNTDKRETFEPLPATHWGLVKNFRDHLSLGDELACDGETGCKSSVVLDVVSNLAEPGEAIIIDYSNPPKFNLSQGAKFKLLA